MPSRIARITIASTACLIALLPASAWAQEQPADEEESEEIVVQATRTGRRVQDEPIRVEVINREEIEEKLLMTPGNIAMLVSETPGVRVQVTSPALGASNVRMQGLKGRYTQVLADGLPLYGGQTPSIGLLQIPPTDLGQVEVIKGAASALYGPSALGGVINLVSRRPGAAPAGELLLNATTRDGQDVTGYAASPLAGGLSASLTAGFDRQSQQDLDDDGWSDMPRYERWTARPRLFWEGSGGTKALLTFGAMTEQRDGGTLPGRAVPDGTPFVQAQHSERFDLGLNAETPLEGVGTLYLRASGVTQSHRHQFGETVENDRHRTGFVEASLGGKAGSTTWLAGAAFQADGFRSRAFPAFDYSYTVPALFVQGESKVAEALTLAASARWDAHSEYGSRISPRLSALYRPGRGRSAPRSGAASMHRRRSSRRSRPMACPAWSPMPISGPRPRTRRRSTSAMRAGPSKPMSACSPPTSTTPCSFARLPPTASRWRMPMVSPGRAARKCCCAIVGRPLR